MAMEIILIRHAESVAQAGAESSDVALIPLSEEGRTKAAEIASRLLRPDLIIVSPFIRTRQTAQSLIDLYPDVPVEEWAVQEFTYLNQNRCAGMTALQRSPLVREYWDRDDPVFVDGDSAESFNKFSERVADFLKRCQSFEGRIYIFSHAMFMQAVRMLMVPTVDSLNMNEFREACFQTPIRNLEGLTVKASTKLIQ